MSALTLVRYTMVIRQGGADLKDLHNNSNLLTRNEPLCTDAIIVEKLTKHHKILIWVTIDDEVRVLSPHYLCLYRTK